LRSIVIVACEAEIKHGETIIIALHEQRYQWRDPAHQRDQRQKDQGNEVNSLPATITQGNGRTAGHFFFDRRPPRRGFIITDDGFRFPADISEDGRTDDEADVFEKGKVKQQQGQPEDHTGDRKKETQQIAMELLRPLAEMQEMCDVFNDDRGRFSKEIHTRHKQCSIDQPRYQYPFP